MAGHSKFKNIQHRKGAQDKKRAKLFTKLVREIITSARIGGIEPSSNPRLRSAISAGRSHNLPKERIDRALLAASDNNETDNYTEIQYEGFLPGGIAIIVEALTDNKNRTASSVRSYFTKYGGNLGETGCVAFMFDHCGVITYNSEKITAEKFFEEAIEAGCIDVESSETEHIAYTEIQNFNECLESISSKLGDPIDSGIRWVPQNNILIESLEKAEKTLKFIDTLEEDDDVQNVFYNFELSEEIYAKLT